MNNSAGLFWCFSADVFVPVRRCRALVDVIAAEACCLFGCIRESPCFYRLYLFGSLHS